MKIGLVRNKFMSICSNLPDTTRPDSFVQAGIDTDIFRVHLLLSEFADDLDRSW